MGVSRRAFLKRSIAVAGAANVRSGLAAAASTADGDQRAPCDHRQADAAPRWAREGDRGPPQTELAALTNEAHEKICPYSHATRNNASVEFEVRGA